VTLAPLFTWLRKQLLSFTVFERLGLLILTRSAQDSHIIVRTKSQKVAWKIQGILEFGFSGEKRNTARPANAVRPSTHPPKQDLNIRQRFPSASIPSCTRVWMTVRTKHKYSLQSNPLYSRNRCIRTRYPSSASDSSRILRTAASSYREASRSKEEEKHCFTYWVVGLQNLETSAPRTILHWQTTY
jgi:hypothetical protein